MIDYACEAVILVAGIAFLTIVLLQWRAGAATQAGSTALPAELTPTAAIEVVPGSPAGDHLVPTGRQIRRGRGPAVRPRRRPLVRP